ncbi:carcinoembryonic antigen-related cell adhesion molecule 6 [Trichomycterus rosablanca]|uniref:carcinoembryonic antigen-related cell adhesion molecule 6 n=1 Tax=Trichomycterus rosablanca TaxID=2290929 RepID=UPI002F355F37
MMCSPSNIANPVTLLLLACSITGSICNLVIVPTGPGVVTASVGANVTLGVTYSGVTDPLVTWLKGTLILATHNIGSGANADIASEYRGVLSVDQTGSLVLQNVLVSYSGTYTVQMAKSGAHEASLNFTLFVYDKITDVSVDAGAQDVVEGGATMTLSYSYLQGPASTFEWYFKGLEIRNNSRYSITQKSLTVNRPSRSDAGNYSVVLRNPFSSVNQSIKVAVLYGPDQPVLEVSPAKAAFVSGETLTLSCRAAGEPVPTAHWVYKGRTLPSSSDGALQLPHVQTSQSGVYTCVLSNGRTKAQLERNVTIDVRGLSGSAIAAIAAGVPCGILLLLLIAALIFLCYYCHKKKDRNPEYPVAKAVEKAVMNQPDLTRPHQLLTIGLKPPPDYNIYHLQMSGERSGPLPSALPPVRLATTV